MNTKRDTDPFTGFADLDTSDPRAKWRWAYRHLRMTAPGTYRYTPMCDPLYVRQNALKRMQANAVGRTVYWLSWGRDCDMCEATTVQTYPVNIPLWVDRLNRMEADAEGPWSHSIIKPEDAAQYPEYHMRDRIAEAWDNGSNYLV